MVRYLILAAMISGASATAQVWHVNVATSAVEPDGLSWETAFATIQPAIDAAAAAGGGEVWVAAGVYSEQREGPPFTYGGFQTFYGALYIRDGIAVYGGFAGTESSREERDITENLTVIDGSNALGGAPSQSVVYLSDDARLDGFKITNHNAPAMPDYRGGGVWCGGTNRTMTIANCLFENLRADLGGAIASAGQVVPIIENCVFRNNSAMAGGAIASIGQLVVRDSVFEGNSAPLGGGAIYASEDFNFNPEYRRSRITGCEFRGNRAMDDEYGWGGAVFGEWLYDFVNCLFVENEAEVVGGCVASRYSPVSFVNCTLVGNRAARGGVTGAGQRPPALTPTLLGFHFFNSISWDNGPDPFVNIRESPPDMPLIRIAYSNVEELGDLPDSASLFEVISTPPRFVAQAIGDFRLAADSPCIDVGAPLSGYLVYHGSEELVLAPDLDIRGIERPVGEAHDLGAYEYDPNVAKSPYDVTSDGAVDATDIQSVINDVLGAAVDVDVVCDIDGDGIVDARDVQLIINAVLGMG